MNSFSRDLAFTTLWALSIYLLATITFKTANNFLVSEPNALIGLAIASLAIIKISSGWFASFSWRTVKTYITIGYQSLSAVNICFGLFFALIAVEITFQQSEIAILMETILVFIIFFSIGVLIALQARIIKEREPVASSEDKDYLDRKIFIKKVISLLRDEKKLVSKSDNEALVIWIASRWGTGKSWVLRQIQRQFQKETKSKPVIWFSFNPWLHSAADPETTLVEAFFSQLADEVDKHFFLEGLNTHIANYTKSILAQGSQKLFNLDIGNIFSSSETTEDLKAHISDFLIQARIKLIVTFDEVDRLTPDEIVTCLRLIRSLANFSNTTILVCGAPDKVELLLHKAGLPRDYLEKIAHVPLSLPLVGVDELIDVLWSHLPLDNLPLEQKNIIENALENLRSNKSNSNDQTFLFDNLRVVERLADVIRLDFIGQEKFEEVDCFDFINLQLLRLNCFPLYEAIKNNKAMWISDERTGLRAENLEHKAKLEAIVVEAVAQLDGSEGKKAALKRLLEQLFSRYKTGIHPFHYAGNKGRISIDTDDGFDRYFVEGMPGGQVSNRSIKMLISNWEADGDIKESMSDSSPSKIGWIFRELTTNEAIVLRDPIKIKLIRFLIDEKIDQRVEYRSKSYRAAPEDFKFDNSIGYRDVVEYYFSKSADVNQDFFMACDYVNAVYWDKERQGILEVSADDIQALADIARREFKERVIDRGGHVLSLNEKDLHYYWYIMTRKNAEFEAMLRSNISATIEDDASAFCKYLYVYREYAQNGRDGFGNKYSRPDGFTLENIRLAKKHLEQQGLSEDERDDLEVFITIAEKNLFTPSARAVV